MFPLMSPCNVVSIAMVTWPVLLSDFMGKWNYTKFEQRSSSVATYLLLVSDLRELLLSSLWLVWPQVSGGCMLPACHSQVIRSLGDVKCFLVFPLLMELQFLGDENTHTKSLSCYHLETRPGCNKQGCILIKLLLYLQLLAEEMLRTGNLTSIS